MSNSSTPFLLGSSCDCRCNPCSVFPGTQTLRILDAPNFTASPYIESAYEVLDDGLRFVPLMYYCGEAGVADGDTTGTPRPGIFAASCAEQLFHSVENPDRCPAVSGTVDGNGGTWWKTKSGGKYWQGEFDTNTLENGGPVFNVIEGSSTDGGVTILPTGQVAVYHKTNGGAFNDPRAEGEGYTLDDAGGLDTDNTVPPSVCIRSVGWITYYSPPPACCAYPPCINSTYTNTRTTETASVTEGFDAGGDGTAEVCFAGAPAAFTAGGAVFTSESGVSVSSAATTTSCGGHDPFTVYRTNGTTVSSTVSLVLDVSYDMTLLSPASGLHTLVAGSPCTYPAVITETLGTLDVKFKLTEGNWVEIYHWPRDAAYLATVNGDVVQPDQASDSVGALSEAMAFPGELEVDIPYTFKITYVITKPTPTTTSISASLFVEAALEPSLQFDELHWAKGIVFDDAGNPTAIVDDDADPHTSGTLLRGIEYTLDAISTRAGSALGILPNGLTSVALRLTGQPVLDTSFYPGYSESAEFIPPYNSQETIEDAGGNQYATLDLEAIDCV